MRLDQGSLIFKTEKGECPSWETALGQANRQINDYPPYYFKSEGFENILMGMMFNLVPLSEIKCVLGKKKEQIEAEQSFLKHETPEIQFASKFDNIFVHYNGNEKKINKVAILLLLTKIQDPNKDHYGRRSIKYSPHTEYKGKKNISSFKKIQDKFKNRLTCYGLIVEKFNELHLYCTNADNVSSDKWKKLILPEKDLFHEEDIERLRKEKIFDNENGKEDVEKDLFSSDSTHSPSQIIYYGVPGCGKSHKINEILKKVPEFNKIRTVFHPEYTNADFIGQILPKIPEEGGVRYEFIPGPFAKILRRAYLNPKEHFYLVIEEINRGNAAAIFGDVFQLMDRLKLDESDNLENGNIYTSGWSQYFVCNDDINAYIRDAALLDQEKANDEKNSDVTIPDDSQQATESTPKKCYSKFEINGFENQKIQFSVNTGIRLPPNLSILATMNTSDQNVFTLDNAFQRRFDMVLVRNEFKEDEINTAQKEAKIAETEVTWEIFWEWINGKISEKLKGNSSTEDKRLGVWFVHNVDGKIDKRTFAEKVLKYLWDDVFKFKRKEVFADDCDTLESLIQKFEAGEKGDFSVFKSFYSEVKEACGDNS